MAKAKRARKRTRSAVTLGDPSKRHPSNLGKQLLDACNQHPEVTHVGRLCLVTLGFYADKNGWSFPGGALLESGCAATEKTVSSVLSVLMQAGLVACIEAHERRGKTLAWGSKGAPLNAEELNKRPTAKLYLLKTIAPPEALAWFDNAQRVIGRAPPENPALSRWAIASKGEREPFHLGKDIIEMIRRRELDGSALVRADSMRDPWQVCDVPAFASAIPAPRRYFLDHIEGTKSFSEAELADMVRGAVLRNPAHIEAWPDDAPGTVKLGDLPRVAIAIAERRALVTRHENDDVRAAG